MQPSPSTRPPRTTLTSMNITFLGTASAQPSSTRNHSCLALRLGGDVWLFDCGEATQHQIQRSKVKMGKIEKVFITHTHGDHIFGLLPLLASRLNGAGGTVDAADDTRLTEPPADQPPFEIYGPLGTRAYVRNGLTYTHTLLNGPYVVHELRFPSDPPGDFTALPPHTHEQPGRNIAQAADGTWPAVFADDVVSVSAAPILHSAPCVGYVVAEAPVPGKIDPARYVPHLKRTGTPMSAMRALQRGERVRLPDGTVLEGPPRREGRTLAILGDTYDPSAIFEALAHGADVLVHEATNAYLPGVDPDTKESDTRESVQARTMSRGHSTPQMAGAFAARVGARKLVLNHFSPRYAGDDDRNEESRKVIDAIRALACEEYKGEIVCARDFMSFDVELKS